MWIMKRVHPNTKTAIWFLCIKVSKSGKDDEKKLRRLIAYIKGTINEVRLIWVNNLAKIFTQIDMAYAVNPDIKCQTGRTISMDVWVLYIKSYK